MGTSLPRLIGLLGACGLIIAAVVALSVARADSPADRRPTAPVSEGALVGRTAPSGIDRRLTDTFGVLRSPRTESDMMPTAAVDFVHRTGIGGMNPDLSQRVISDGDYSVFVVPGDDFVCLYAVSGTTPAGAGGGCTHVADAVDGSLVMIGTTGDGVRINGLAPDGVKHATIALANGDRVEAPVVENVYTAVVDTSVESVSVSGDGREATLPTPFPVLGK